MFFVLVTQARAYHKNKSKMVLNVFELEPPPSFLADLEEVCCDPWDDGDLDSCLRWARSLL